MKKRNAIELSPEQQRDFLASSKTIILSTIDGHGYPHSVAMWYVADDDGSILMTTYAKSQKALNIRRNPKVSLLVESGVAYAALKGVLIRGEAELIEDFDQRLSVIARIHQKMSGSLADGVDEAMKRQAAKRTLIKVVPKRTSSWDHSKLGGAY